jgi:hypothetical protein
MLAGTLILDKVGMQNMDLSYLVRSGTCVIAIIVGLSNFRKTKDTYQGGDNKAVGARIEP